MRPPRWPLPDRSWYAPAGLLLLGGPVWLEFYQGGYSFRRAEAWVLPLAAAGIGFLAGLWIRRFREPAATVGFALLVLIFVDLQFDAEAQLSPMLIAVGVLGAVTVFGRHRGLLVVITLSAFYLTSLPTRQVDTGIAVAPLGRSSRPTLLHIVLDAQWGPVGFRSVGDTATAEFLETFYGSRGFRLFRGAYSRYDMTRYALGSIAALGRESKHEARGGGGFKLAANRYFDRLLELGYHVRVFESSHLDLCSKPSRALWCRSVPSSDIVNVGYLDGPWVTRAELTARFLLSVRSYVYRTLHGRDPLALRRSVAGRAIAWGDSVRRAITEQRGDAYFVHLILPHRPHEVDSGCAMLSSVKARLVANGYEGGTFANQVSAYAEQTRCVHRVVAGLLAALDSVVGDRSIVVIHGDHGPRWGFDEATDDRSEPRQLIGDYSTLFAVRAGGIPAGTVDSAAAIQELMADLVARDFQAVSIRPGSHWVARERERIGRDRVRMLSGEELRWLAPGDTVVDRRRLASAAGSG